MTANTILKERLEPLSNIRRSNTAEQFLENLALNIQIPESRYEEAVKRYKSLKKWLMRNDSTLREQEPEVSLQGSFKLGTVVKPIRKGEEYDIDLVCTTTLTKSDVTQENLKAMLGVEISSYAQAQGMQRPESKRRCWRVRYAKDAQFHMDALPSIPESKIRRLILEANGVSEELTHTTIAITDEEHVHYHALSDDWLSSNPAGYSRWFYDRMQDVFRNRWRVLAETTGTREEDIPEYKVKTPLQSAIQILKRHRDMTHDGEIKDKPISIIITTLAAQAYSQQANISDALYAILFGMENHIEHRGGICWVLNPTNPQENFADKWQEFPIRQEKFFEWLNRAKTDFAELAQLTDQHHIAETMAPVLGQRLVEQTISEKRNSKTHRKPNLLVRLLNPSHRRKPEWQESLHKQVHVEAKVRRNGFRKQAFESDSTALPKNCDLFFEATTNVLAPYETYWQVVNTGAQAKGAGQLRGGFEFSTTQLGRNIRKESTCYRGSHSVECFIVKNNVCVARSGQFVVNIK